MGGPSACYIRTSGPSRKEKFRVLWQRKNGVLWPLSGDITPSGWPTRSSRRSSFSGHDGFRFTDLDHLIKILDVEHRFRRNDRKLRNSYALQASVPLFWKRGNPDQRDWPDDSIR